MTSFQGGPANSTHLNLRRAPFFLRVTKDSRGFDALDQLSDEPTDSEQLFAYIIEGRPGHCHLNMGRGRGGFYTIATYNFIPSQPPQETMRDNTLWSEWCCANAKAFGFDQWLEACKP